MKKFTYLLAVLTFFANICVHAENIQVQTPTIITKSAEDQSIDNLTKTYNNDIKMIFSDIDGTLLKFNSKNGRTPIPHELKNSVKQLQKNHLPFILMTGRPYFEAKDVAKRMNYKGDYIVSLQGAEVHDSKGKLIYEDIIKDEDSENILNTFEQIKKEHNLDSNIYMFIGDDFYSTATIKPVYNWQKLTTVKSLKMLGPKYSCKMIFVYEDDPAKIGLIQSELKKKYPQYQVVFAGHCYCNITSNTANKGNALNKLAKIKDVELKNIAACGDSENDLSMLEEVKKAGGLAIAVENAIQILKENANYITPSVTENGFSKAVSEILKNNQRLKNKK